MCFYPLVEGRMVKPLFILDQFAFETFGGLPKVIDELLVEVLDASFDLILVLRMRRTRKINLNTALTAPFLRLLLELAVVIGKNSLRKPSSASPTEPSFQLSSTLGSNCSAQAHQPPSMRRSAQTPC
jgi:hypothetical protein